MKKFNADIVGGYWAVFIMIALVIGGGIIFGMYFLLTIAVAMFVGAVAFGTPYAITWFWNKYIAEED